MSLITLTSDYGITDYRIPVIKGLLSGLPSDYRIVDISHSIPAFDLAHTGFLLRHCIHLFPKKSVHLVFVDSFYSKNSMYLAANYNDRWIICKDNGLLSLIFPEILPDSVYEITINNRFDDVEYALNADIMIPAAEHLVKGGLPDIIGRKITDFHVLKVPNPVVKENSITGQIIYIDHFGNLVSNISKELLLKLIAKHESFTIHIRNIKISTLFKRYSGLIENEPDENLFHGRPMAYFNITGYLEIALYKGIPGNGAKELLGMNKGDFIRIDFK